MSITSQLEHSVEKLRALIKRGNGDILEAGPLVLDDLDAVADQVRGLENATNLSSELLREFQENGGCLGEKYAN